MRWSRGSSGISSRHCISSQLHVMSAAVLILNGLFMCAPVEFGNFIFILFEGKAPGRHIFARTYSRGEQLGRLNDMGVRDVAVYVSDLLTWICNSGEEALYCAPDLVHHVIRRRWSLRGVRPSSSATSECHSPGCARGDSTARVSCTIHSDMYVHSDYSCCVPCPPNLCCLDPSI